MIRETQIALTLAENGVANFDFRNEDCVVGLKSLEAESIDVIVTSPPYNIDTKYRTYKDCGRRNEYLDWCCSWGKELGRVLGPAAPFF